MITETALVSHRLLAPISLLFLLVNIFIRLFDYGFYCKIKFITSANTSSSDLDLCHLFAYLLLIFVDGQMFNYVIRDYRYYLSWAMFAGVNLFTLSILAPLIHIFMISND